jgi:hypothetical protein
MMQQSAAKHIKPTLGDLQREVIKKKLEQEVQKSQLFHYESQNGRPSKK